jgi:nucleoside-diphosphate-sugar epimerase
VYTQTNSLSVKEDAVKLEGPQPELGQFADYAYNKWRAEKQLMELCGSSGTNWTIIRPAFIYGKFNYAPRENYFFDLIVKNEKVVIPEPPHFLFSFVSVWDAARIIGDCMGNKAVYGMPFNASAAEQVSYPILIDVFREVTGIPFKVEAWNNKRIIEENIPLPFPIDEHLVYDGTLITDTLNFRYTPFLEGMRETYKFYRIGRGMA